MSFTSEDKCTARFFQKTLLTLLVTTSLASLAEASPAQFVGTWVNMNRSSRGIVRVVVSPGMQVRTYGSCSPNPCDWGLTSMTTFGRNISDRDHNASIAHYQFSFKRTIVVGKLLNPNILQVEDFNEFTDSSGRQNYHNQERFRKATAEELSQNFPSTSAEPAN